jgi:uncharacterized protein (DUF433 family)
MPTALGEQITRLEEPRYGFSEADHLAAVTRGTARRWLTGYQYRHRGELVSQPPVPYQVRNGAADGVSFVDLVELVAIGKLKTLNFSLPMIRKVVQNCRELLHTEHPLASLQFHTRGAEIFVENDGRLLEVGRRKGIQAWHEVLEPFLKTLDYEEEIGLAVRWWPLGKGTPIVVDPEFGFGLPVVAGSGVRTEVVFEQFQRGARLHEIAQDFRISPEHAEQAVGFEASRLAA